jgi:hypothetical protein
MESQLEEAPEPERSALRNAAEWAEGLYLWLFAVSSSRLIKQYLLI